MEIPENPNFDRGRIQTFCMSGGTLTQMFSVCQGGAAETNRPQKSVHQYNRLLCHIKALLPHFNLAPLEYYCDPHSSGNKIDKIPHRKKNVYVIFVKR